MNTSKEFTNLTAMKLLRLSYVLLAIAIADFWLALAGLIEHLSPGNGILFFPFIFLSAVGGVLTAVFWFLRLIWLFVAYKPDPEPVSQQKLKVTFFWLILLIAFEGISYYVTH